MTESDMPMKPKSREKGFALLEVMIAILIFSFGLLGLVGLQANMIKQSTDARYRAVASYLAQQKLGEMWANPASVGTLLENEVDVSASLPAGTRSVSQPVAGRFVVTVRWQQPGQTQHVFTTTASIAGG